MSIQGWIIQINPGFPGNLVAGQPSDEGDRSNLCTANRNPPFWTNQSIELTNTSFGTPSTSAKVGDSAIVQVTCYAGSGISYTNYIKTIQAWVCYPNSVPNEPNFFNLNTVVPSMNPMFLHSKSPPSWSSAPPGVYITASMAEDVPNDYVGPPLGTLPGLAPPWQPIEQDILAAPSGLQPPNEAHACIVVTSSGTSDASGSTQNVGFSAAGNDPTGVDVCSDGHAGQLNINIFGALPGGLDRGPRAGFAFLAGTAAREKAALSVTVSRVIQNEQIDPVVLKFLRAGPYGKLPLRPSNTAPTSFGLMKNGHALHHSWLGKFFEEVEDELKEAIEDIEHVLSGTRLSPDKLPKRSINVKAPSSGIYPLLFHAEFDPGEPAGNVHVFDIVQTDERTGRRGGIRVAAVIARKQEGRA